MTQRDRDQAVVRKSSIKGEDLRLLRQQASVPVLDHLKEYLLKIQDQVLLKSEAGQAIAYAVKNWVALNRRFPSTRKAASSWSRQEGGVRSRSRSIWGKWQLRPGQFSFSHSGQVVS